MSWPGTSTAIRATCCRLTAELRPRSRPLCDALRRGRDGSHGRANDRTRSPVRLARDPTSLAEKLGNQLSATDHQTLDAVRLAVYKGLATGYLSIIEVEGRGGVSFRAERTTEDIWEFWMRQGFRVELVQDRKARLNDGP